MIINNNNSNKNQKIDQFKINLCIIIFFIVIYIYSL